MGAEHEHGENNGRAILAAESVNSLEKKAGFSSFLSKVKLGGLIGALVGGLAGAATLDVLNIPKGMVVGAGVGAALGTGTHGVMRLVKGH